MPSTLSHRLPAHPPAQPRRASGLAVVVTLLAALVGFFLLVLHDAMSHAATQQTQSLQQVSLLWEGALPCDAVEAAAQADCSRMRAAGHGTAKP